MIAKGAVFLIYSEDEENEKRYQIEAEIWKNENEKQEVGNPAKPGYLW